MSLGDTYPIALACGFTRMDQTPPWKWLHKPGSDDFHYFKKIRSTLNAAGFRAFHTQVAWGAPLAVRASDLAREIDSILAISGAKKVHVIGHSMGGLDTRYAIAFLGCADKVASLTTIATPHHGSPLADLVVEHKATSKRVLEWMKSLGLDVRGIVDLTTQECEARNARLEPLERGNGVVYQTYAGVAEFLPTFPPLKAGYLMLKLRYHCPENDGLVPLESAKWRDAVFRGTVTWDHLNQIGWWTPERMLAGDFVASRFEESVREFYVGVARELHGMQ